MITYSLYVIDDDDDLRSGIVTALEDTYRVNDFSTAEAAIEVMKNNPADLILLDIALPGMNGIEALPRIKQLHPDSVVIMISALEDINTVISAMKSGAYDYVLKPMNIDVLEMAIRKAVQTIALKKEIEMLQERCLAEQFPWFIGESQEIQGVMSFVKKVARSPDTPVLILGETGTGKELVARAIHLNSPNSNGPMVAVNCAAIPRELVESELFGYERGAFSGARSGGKRGLIEEAANGTLFMDEVGDLCPEAQAKLLRFLEDGRYYRVGATKPRNVQTRVISATNKNLDRMIEGGLFREDLYYRLGAIRIEVPSLNKRPEDIVPLAHLFLAEFNRKFGKSFIGITAETERALMNFHWQGNIRELKNMIERGVLVGRGPELTIEDFGMTDRRERSDRQGERAAFEPQIERGKIGTTVEAEKRPMQWLEEDSSSHAVPSQKENELTPRGIDLTALLQSVEKDYLAEALKLAGGNECNAARLLNLNHHTFRYRRRKLGIR